jgi:hypothetical protein
VSRRVLLSAGEDLAAWIAGRLPPGPDWSDRVVIFPHDRPRHGLNRLLAARAGGPFFPPAYFTLPRFQEAVLRLAGTEPVFIAPLDALDLMMELLGRETEGELGRLAARPALAWAWAARLVEAVDELDAAMVPAAGPLLAGVPELPADSRLGEAVLERLADLRRAWHAALEERGLLTRGLAGWRAAEAFERASLDRWEEVVVVLPEGLTRAEAALVRALARRPGAVLVASGEAPEALEGLAFESEGGAPDRPEPVFLSAYDTHSEIEALRGAMADLSPEALARSAVVLLREEALVPLLEQVLAGLGVDYNISLGYPFKRTPVFALVRALMELHAGRREGLYPAPLYREVLLHPYIKNLGSGPLGAEEARITAQAVDAHLAEQGRLHLDPYALAANSILLAAIARRLPGRASEADAAAHLEFLHGLLLRPFESAADLGGAAAALRGLLAALVGAGDVQGYAFTGEFFHTLCDFLDGLESSTLAARPLKPPFLFDLFVSLLGEARVGFTGLPMQGLQVLGLLEARHLRFDHVFVLDANEGTLPSLAVEDPVLPLGVRRTLGLPGPEERQAAAKLRFDGLLASCRSAHVLFLEGEESMPSRFVLQRIWERERATGVLSELKGEPVSLELRIAREAPPTVPKSATVAAALRRREWSPSSVDAYLACPLRFYYGRVAGLEEREALEEGFDAGIAGLILHRAMELLYQGRLGRPLGRADYAAMAADLPRCLERAYAERGWETRGEAYLIFRLMERRIARFLRQEEREGGAHPERLEWPLRGEAGGWRFKGVLDRVDRTEGGALRVLDYKSGRAKPFLKKSGAPVQGRDACLEAGLGSFQMAVYARLAGEAAGVPCRDLEVVTVSLRDFERRELFKEVPDRDAWMEAVALPTLFALLEEIADPARPFTADPADERLCRTCPFGALCPNGGGV